MSNSIIAGRGDAQVTVSSTSVGLPSIPTGAQRAMIYISGADVHWSNDDTDAVTTSPVIRADTYLNLTDHRYQLETLRFLRRTTTDATLRVNYYN